MDEALIGVLEKKDFAYITVKEICEAAQVNRSTFYLHYENTADLLAEALGYINEKFIGYFQQDAAQTLEKIRTGTLQELIFITPDYLIPYLRFISENKRFFMATLKSNTDVYHSRAKFNSLYQAVFEPVFERFSVPESERKYTIAFYVQGIMGIVTEWIRRECEDDAEQISALITDLIFSGKRVQKYME